jgi:uncharacterized protein HemY
LILMVTTVLIYLVLLRLYSYFRKSISEENYFAKKKRTKTQLLTHELVYRLP